MSKLIYINKKGESKEYIFNSAAYKKEYIEKHNLKSPTYCEVCQCEVQKIGLYHHNRTAKHIKTNEILNNILMTATPEQQNNKEYINKLLQEELFKLKVSKQIANFRQKYKFENIHFNISCN
jgi:hypothetical protein